ncbi:MAG: hypothetical protein MK102_09195, partial [Fuerstiella sp.]|nr:hypothetical protein [Fuerstiella sp.]
FVPRKFLGPARNTRRPSASRIFMVMGITTLGCLPLIRPLLRLREWSAFMELQSVVAPDLTNVVGPVWLTSVPAIIITAVLLRLLQRRQNDALKSECRPLLMISGSIALGSLLIFLTFSFCGLYSLAANPRYQVAFSVAMSLFLAATARTLTAPLSRNGIQVLCVCLIAITVTWLNVGRSPLLPARLNGVAAEEWRQAAHTTADQSQNDDLILVQSGLVESFLVPRLFNDPLFMDYVACRLGKFYVPQQRQRLALPAFWSRAPEMTEFFRSQFEQVRQRGGSIWIAAATDTLHMQVSLDKAQQLLQECGWAAVITQPKSTMVLERYQFAPDTNSTRPSESVTGNAGDE